MAASLVTEDWILEALRLVIDPELGVNVVDLGLVYGVAVEAGQVEITMTLTTPGCPLHASLSLAVGEAVRTSVPGVEDVRVNLVWDPPWRPERLSEAGRKALGWVMTGPEPILATWKVSEVLRRYPPVAGAAHRPESRLRPPAPPILRRVQTRLVTVAQAARVAGIEPGTLVAALNAAAGVTAPEPASPSPLERTDAGPPAAAAFRDAPVAAELDARPFHERGEEPFSAIMAAAAGVPEGAILRLRNSFEPVPLYGVLARQGFAHQTRQLGPDDWEVRFLRTRRGPREERPTTPERTDAAIATPAPLDTAWDQPTATLTIDVSDLVPPEPMVRILETLEKLPPGGDPPGAPRPPARLPLPPAGGPGLHPRDARPALRPGRDPDLQASEGEEMIGAAAQRAPLAPAGLGTQHAPPLDLPLRFLATAVGGLALLALVYPWHLPLLLGSFLDRHLLTFVHVNTLGVIAATILGASYQLLPVVVQSPLAWVRLARLTWWLYLPGLVLFALGLSQSWRPLTLAGGSLLYVSVALYVAIVWRTLWRAARRDVVVWHVFLATVSLAVGATLGIMLAHAGGGGLSGSLILPALAAHATLMVGGWATPMLTGVAYRLVGMFTLSEESLREDWARLELLLTIGGAWTLAASLLLGLTASLGLLGAAGLLAGLGLFAAQLARLYRQRRRRTFDIHIPFTITATLYAVLAAALVLAGLVTGRGPTDPLWLAAGWLAIAGWAETAIQGFLYKIGTFLTWLHRYAPLAGRQPVPKLEDLYGRRVALAGWASWTAGVALAALAAPSGAGWLAYTAAAALSAGGAAFLVNAARVAAHWRAPASRPRPTPAPTG